jgi:hypothetical protein
MVEFEVVSNATQLLRSVFAPVATPTPARKRVSQRAAAIAALAKQEFKAEGDELPYDVIRDHVTDLKRRWSI